MYRINNKKHETERKNDRSDIEISIY